MARGSLTALFDHHPSRQTLLVALHPVLRDCKALTRSIWGPNLLTGALTMPTGDARWISGLFFMEQTGSVSNGKHPMGAFCS